MITRHPLIVTSIVAVLAALSSTAALAETPTIDTTPFHAQRSRAEVKADVAIARAMNRLLPAGEADAPAPMLPTHALARADVKAEVLAARAAGTLLPAGELIDGVPRSTPRPLSFTSLARR